MEFEDLNQTVEWEARRVAAAFRVEKWTCTNPNSGEYAYFEGNSEEVKMTWDIQRDPLRLDIVRSEQEEDWCQIEDGLNSSWLYEFNFKHAHLFARGLYCLGIEDEGVLAALNHPLTAHEKLELRLSMPREFWPEAWLNEERR